MAIRHWLDSNGNWTTAADWSGDTVPRPTDDAIIDATGSYTVSEDATSTAPIDVDSIEINTATAVLAITDVAGNQVFGSAGVTNSGTLALHNNTALTNTTALTVDGGFTNNTGATLDVDNAVNTFDGGVTYSEGGSSLTVTGTLANTGTVQVGDSVTFPEGNVSHGLTAATSVTLGGLTNSSGASFIMDGSAAHAADLAFSGGAASFTTNGGTFELTYLTPLTLGSGFTNSGTFGLHDDTALTVDGGFTNNAGAALDVDNTVNTFAGGITYSEGGSSLTVTGTLANTGTVQVGDSVTFPEGNVSYGLTAATTVTLGGLTNASGASFIVDGSAAHAADLAFSGGAASFTTNGGTFELTYLTPLTLGSGFTNSGTFGLHDDTALTVDGGFTNNAGAALDVDNTVNTFAGGITYSEGGSSLTVTGTLANTGTVQVGDSVTFPEGNVSYGLTAATTVTLGGLTNASGASFIVDGSAAHAADLAFSGGAASFTTNGGTFELTYLTPLTLGSGFTNSGTFGLHDDTALTVDGGFTNNAGAALDVDNTVNTFAGGITYSEGGSSLTVTGTLANTGTVQVGDSVTFPEGNVSHGLTAATTVTLGGLTNASGASFIVDGSAAHAARLSLSSGGFTGNGGTFELTYAAPLTLGSGFTNSGTFGLHDDTALTVDGGFTNNAGATLDVDNTVNTFAGGITYSEGGSSLTVTGTLANTGTVQVGDSVTFPEGNVSYGLTAATTVTLGGLTNASGASFVVDGSAAHAARLSLSSGGFTGNAGTFELTYAAPLTLKSAFTNSGTFGLHDDTALTVDGGFKNSAGATLDVDNTVNTFAGGITYSEGGSSLTVTGTLANTGTVQVGDTLFALTAATTVSLGGLTNSNSISLYGGSSTDTATLKVTGPAVNSGAIGINSFAVLDVTGGNAFTQTDGTTTVHGTLTATTIDIDGGVLTVDTANFTNIGTLAAADGGKIDLSAGGLTNLSGTTLTGGSYVVDAGSTFQLPNNAIVGTLAADLTLSGAGSVMQGFDISTGIEIAIEITLKTIAADGALSVVGGRTYTSTDAITDSGSLTVGAGSIFALTFAAPLNVTAGGALVVDAGGGTVDLSAGGLTNLSGTTLTGGIYVVDAESTLQLPDNTRIVALAADLTVSGPGSVVESLDTATRGQVRLENTLTTIASGGALRVLGGRAYTTTNAIADSGALQLGGGSFTAASLTVTGKGKVSGSGTINERLIVDPGAVFQGTLDGNGSNTIELAGTAPGVLNGLGTTLSDFAAVTVDAGASWTVDARAAALSGVTLTGNARSDTLDLTSAGTFSLSGVSKFDAINLAAGNSTVTVADTTLSGGSVTIKDGISGNNIISAAGDTSASTGKTLIYITGSGSDTFVGGFENDVVKVSAKAVSGDTLTGGSGTNMLDLTTAGTLSLAGVNRFGTINLAASNSTVTVTDTTLSSGSVTINDGASGNNSISAAGDTAKSTGKTLTYVAGTGTDTFAGGFENDVVEVSAAAVGGDTLTGGRGTNTLDLTTAGTADLAGVSRFGTINLAAGNSTVTVADNTLSGGAVTITDGASGNNSISAAGDTAKSTGKTLTYAAGTGTDSFTGGFENDMITVSAAAVGGDTLTGGSGSSTLELTSAGTVDLSGVGKFGAINLATGDNKVTVADNTLSGGVVTIRAGTGDNNIVNATGDTAASTGRTLRYITASGAGTFIGGFENDVVNASGDGSSSAGETLTFIASSGTDTFTGGFENDVIEVSAAAVGGDTLTGGRGTNTLDLTTAGTADLSGVRKFGAINLAAGNSTVTVADNTLSGGAVTITDGASGNNSISAAGDTAKSTGKTLTYVAGTGTDSFTGGFENDLVKVHAEPVGGDTLTGGRGTNTLILTTAGAVDLSGVGKFATIDLAAGDNTVTVADDTLSGGVVTIAAGAVGNNSISAAGDTAASRGETLIYTTGSGSGAFTGGFENDVVNASGDGSSSAGKTFTFIAGSGTARFTGGFENDIVKISAAAVGGDTLTGGSGINMLDLTTAGTLDLAGVSGFQTYLLGDGALNKLTLTNGNFSGLSAAVLMVFGGSGGNTLSEAGVAAADEAFLEGGAGADTLIAGQNAVLIGGAGADVFTLTTPGTLVAPDTNTIADFTNGTDKVAFSEAGFGLGSSPKAASLFTENATGAFTTAAQRFAYDTTDGTIFFGAHGSAGSSHELIATLTGHPTFTTGDITFVA